MIYGWLIYARMCVYACVHVCAYTRRVLLQSLYHGRHADVKKVLSGTAKERGFVRKNGKTGKTGEKKGKKKKNEKKLKNFKKVRKNS